MGHVHQVNMQLNWALQQKKKYISGVGDSKACLQKEKKPCKICKMKKSQSEVTGEWRRQTALLGF